MREKEKERKKMKKALLTKKKMKVRARSLRMKGWSRSASDLMWTMEQLDGEDGDLQRIRA
jgi:hypothetical protein